MTRPQDIIAGWEAAIKANEEHIQRKQKLVMKDSSSLSLSGIKVLDAENESIVC